MAQRRGNISFLLMLASIACFGGLVVGLMTGEEWLIVWGGVACFGFGLLCLVGDVIRAVRKRLRERDRPADDQDGQDGPA